MLPRVRNSYRTGVLEVSGEKPRAIFRSESPRYGLSSDIWGFACLTSRRSHVRGVLQRQASVQSPEPIRHSFLTMAG